MSLSEQTNKSIINYLWAVSGMTNGNLWAIFFAMKAVIKYNWVKTYIKVESPWK